MRLLARPTAPPAYRLPADHTAEEESRRGEPIGVSGRWARHHGGMRYRRAVEKLRILAEACESVKRWPPEDPFLLEAYTFGDVLRGADPLDCVEVVLVLNLPPQDVVWGSNPHGTVWLADHLRLSKGGF